MAITERMKATMAAAHMRMSARTQEARGERAAKLAGAIAAAEVADDLSPAEALKAFEER